MASKLELNNANGKKVSIINSDTNVENREVTIDKIVQHVTDRDSLKAKIGTAGDVVKQVDIALDYEWDSTITADDDNGGTIIYVNDGGWRAIYNGAIEDKWFGLNTNNLTFSQNIRGMANIDFSNIPTSDPLVAGQLWNNDGVVTVSKG